MWPLGWEAPRLSGALICLRAFDAGEPAEDPRRRVRNPTPASYLEQLYLYLLHPRHQRTFY